MNWRRTDKRRSKHHKEWQAGRGNYRVTWRDRVQGVVVTPGYHACVRVLILGRLVWDFVNPKRQSLYRTMKAAKDACEKHADPSYKPVRKKRRK